MCQLKSYGSSETIPDNARFATSYILRNILERQPDLFNEASNLILMDLDCSYDLSWSALPSRPEWENTQQKDLRVLMIEQWMEDLDEAFKVTEEKFNSCHRRQFLTTLLYAIWNDWNQKQ